jgi:large repetitive protein
MRPDLGQQDYGWVSGRATAVAVDPADATGNTVYIGGAYGGVWKSTNAGPLSPNPASVSWSPLIDNQATLAVGSIAIQPGNADPTKSVILVGTGETNSSMDSYYGLGILRSADAGNTWTLITQDSSGTHSFAGMGFSKIAFSTANPGLVVAAAAGASQGVIDGLETPVNTNRGIYYSNNGGVSWNYANISDVGTAIQPNSATSVIYNAVAGRFFAAIRFHGFYSSSDGVNWTRLATQPGGLSTFACPTTQASQGCPIYRGEFAVVPGRNEM